ncbi:hypothetical protein llap_7368 [Limosa lapponica baueri]|uniref:Uncharacterized protein n=1 Tax=Limosa lapponica baueri TaxID=1758121 RepID=A0A2I0U8E6_LIMLA|nr:hypothetical protein llap_7368 [Limosa lapponica baueri]
MILVEIKNRESCNMWYFLKAIHARAKRFHIIIGTLMDIVGNNMRDHSNSAFLSKAEGITFLIQLQEESHLLKHHLKQAFPIHGVQHIMCLSSRWNSKTLCQVLQNIVRYGGILAAALATVLEKLALTSHDSHKGQMLKF